RSGRNTRQPLRGPVAGRGALPLYLPCEGEKPMTATKTALVTGIGNRRLGWHVADALARRGYGLVVTYRTSAAAATEGAAQFRAHGVDALAVAADLSDEEAVRGVVRAAVDRFGRLDVLVNCAGLWKGRPLEEVTAADVRAHFEANVLSTFLCARHAGLVM